MKKLLTVLLAAAMVLTYSVPAVFATTDASTFNANVNVAQQQITATLDTNYANAVKSISDTTVSGVVLSKEALAGSASLYKDKVAAEITARTNEIKGKYASLQDLTVNQIVALYSEPATDNNATTTNDPNGFTSVAVVLDQVTLYNGIIADTDVLNAAARTQFASNKAAVLAAINSVDLSVYSTTTPTTGDTYYALAKAVVDTAVTNVTNTTVASDATLAQVKAALTSIGTFAAATQNTTTGAFAAGAAGTGYIIGIEKVVNAADSTVVVKYQLRDKNIKTKADESVDTMTLAARKAAYISQVNANAAQFLADHATATGDFLTAINAEKAAYVAGMTEIINAASTSADLTAIAATAAALPVPAASTTAVTSNYAANAKLIAQLEATATKYKAYTDANGNKVKDASAIDDVVAAAKTTAYKVDAPWTGLAAAQASIINGCNAVTKDSAAVAAEKAAIENDRKAALQTSGTDNYYAPEAAKVNALFDALLAKVDAATSTAAVQAVYTNNASVSGLSAIPTKTQVKTSLEGMTSFGTNATSIAAYENYLNANLNSASAGYRDFSALNDDFFADLYATNGARTDAEVAAQLSAAKAACDAVKTNEALATEKKAVEAQIAALPSTITAANADAVIAAYKAATAYNTDANKTMATTDIANVATLNLATKALHDALAKALQAEYAALPTTTTVADKAAVKALLEKVNTFDDNCAAGEIFAGLGDLSSTATNLTDKLTAIRGLELAAVNSAIDALPLNITIANKDAVEAARKAYDAYVKEYTDYTTAAPSGYHQNAAEDVTSTMYKSLSEAESQLAVAVAAQAKLVQSYKITASSKAYKGKMVIKWTVNGTAVTGVKYQIYRSTQKKSGFVKMFTTSKLTYTNTKNLKAGKTYYYKVRAYITIDGVKYYSDWSNKAFRTAK